MQLTRLVIISTLCATGLWAEEDKLAVRTSEAEYYRAAAMAFKAQLEAVGAAEKAKQAEAVYRDKLAALGKMLKCEADPQTLECPKPPSP